MRWPGKFTAGHYGCRLGPQLDARVPDTTKSTTGDTTVWTTNKEEETSIAWSTWSISDQARGKKRRRERPDKICNWTRRC